MAVHLLPCSDEEFRWLAPSAKVHRHRQEPQSRYRRASLQTGGERYYRQACCATDRQLSAAFARVAQNDLLLENDIPLVSSQPTNRPCGLPAQVDSIPSYEKWLWVF